MARRRPALRVGGVRRALFHVLRDATDGGTPLLWPLGRRDRVPRWVFAGAVVGLLAASEAIARAS